MRKLHVANNDDQFIFPPFTTLVGFCLSLPKLIQRPRSIELPSWKPPPVDRPSFSWVRTAPPTQRMQKNRPAVAPEYSRPIVPSKSTPRSLTRRVTWIGSKTFAVPSVRITTALPATPTRWRWKGSRGRCRNPTNLVAKRSRLSKQEKISNGQSCRKKWGMNEWIKHKQQLQ